MNPQLALLALGLLGASACLWMFSRGRSQQAVLNQRLATLAPRPAAGGAGQAAGGHAGLRLVARLLTTGAKDRAEIEERMHAAGYATWDNVAVFAVIRVAVVALSAVAVWLYMQGSDAATAKVALYPPAAAAAAFLVAKKFLASRAEAGTRKLNREMPFLLDMLLLLLESGNSLDQCFRYLVQSRVGGMGRTMQTITVLVDDLQKGMPYDQALDRWADRLGVFGARDLAGLFKQSMLYGNEVGPSLREYAREFADRRMATARASVGRQATMMTVVMVAFLMPAVLIMLAGPAVVGVKGAMSQLAGKAKAMPSAAHPGVLKPGEKK